MHSTDETDFSTEVENNQENQYYYIVICLINYKSAWKILLNLHFRIIQATIVPGLESLSLIMPKKLAGNFILLLSLHVNYYRILE